MEVNYIKYWRKSSLKKKKDGNFLLNHIRLKKPKNFLEIGVFHGVTSRNVCELLYSFHGNDFKFTGIDLFVNDETLLKDEYIPKIKFSNPLKTIYYKYIIRLDPYSVDSILRLLKKFQKNVNELWTSEFWDKMEAVQTQDYSTSFLFAFVEYLILLFLIVASLLLPCPSRPSLLLRRACRPLRRGIPCRVTC